MRRYCIKLTILMVIVVMSCIFMNYSLVENQANTWFTILCSSEGAIELLETNRSAIACKNDRGEDVHWFITYKMPRNRKSLNKHFRRGAGYVYFGPDSDVWTPSDYSINDENSAIGLTIADLYKNSDDEDLSAHILYNDKPPGGAKNTELGHNKGLLITNELGGLWLMHSVSQFPVPGLKYEFPIMDYNRGQLFICLTLDPEQVDSIGQILQVTKPNIFRKSVPRTYSQMFPNLSDFLNEYSRDSSEKNMTSEIFELETGGMDFKVFAQAAGSNQEIFSNWVAPTLNANLSVQSWLGKSGDGGLSSNCSDWSHSVYNVKKTNLGPFQFKTGQDHSKWAVSLEPANPWICISDLNRKKHHTVRGGCVICTKDERIWAAFSDSILDIEMCPESDLLDITNPRYN